jgi:hypothetical protein
MVSLQGEFVPALGAADGFGNHRDNSFGTEPLVGIQFLG